MPYVLSFEVNRRYEICLDTVSEAITRYDETYCLIGAWLKKHDASADLRCTETGRVVQLYRGITVLEASIDFGVSIQWQQHNDSLRKSWL
ncbi:hypothetical protein [Pseudomonas sp. B21-048]|uniref:hypothetical protein n=1 Tax=Pseudomonas sp. B21-048 TaxID=2895490 RepID=UPI00215DF184|nr:hypothetical protein [Pseudomonas sp. B21-048]UVL00491.1 hypothetical protein LOY56_09050 [Pseudomonas sp. B21-048]